MLEVNGSYRELTGFQPVELTDNSFAAEKMVHTKYRPLAPALLAFTKRSD